MACLKRVPKRDLCALIRYLNFYELVRRRIHYFSIRVKRDLIYDLGRLYEITDSDTQVTFQAIRGDLPSFLYGYGDRHWERDGEPIQLPKSRRQCMRTLSIRKGQVTLTF